MCQAIDVAKWFIKNNYEPCDTKNGNMKLNKLLYFAQLISLVKRDKVLFNDNLSAFKHGVVVENVRKEYYNNYHNFIQTAQKSSITLSEEEEEVLNITINIFGQVNARELSQLTHEHSCWKDHYEKSKRGNGNYDKQDGIIPINEIVNNYQCDLDLIREILSAYENDNMDNTNDEKCIEIKGVKFYYNPNEVNINDNNIREILEGFPADDIAYTIYIDPTQGLVIY
ncbi:hypothetical protein CLOHAE12215_01393 [Clostridium haemolyticum]|uniref:Antitoxin SocA-like Panacea domain-containing protein n=1 Tax=Clostridium botulinum D str. 1873 TaxID=592027 RepID=A0A9P2LKD5_CLOBO|nr:MULTISPECIES: Panacea domain-containing protein [Clostridium]EES90398.1 conserved hypothetical protein [Clostridium phage D-1873]MCD3216977.1 SocA family protein [Clostridium botulinum C]MCD3245325.1 SocA family protein [Clostridium botulinum C]MCD3261704.1 SocA family protein [Clostridium botulinum C]QPW56433.1 SocA family protein [Clostridium botulinum]